MTKREQLLREVQQLPDPLLSDILEYVRSIRARGDSAAVDTALASEKALAKDWLRPEEDEAWKDL